MTPVGFIGTGAMGSSIASRLVRSREVFVADKFPAATDELVRLGATLSTPAEIASSCREVFVCLPGPTEVSDLLVGPDGIAGLFAEGSVVIDTTTSNPTLDEKLASTLAERKVDFVDAAIAGGVRKAREGTATLMVGATPELFASVAPLLDAVTSQVVHVGPLGTGHAMKLVNNLLNSCNRFAALETIRLGEMAGLKRDVIIDVLNRSSGRNYATEYTYPQLLTGDGYKPQGFTIDLMLKDVRLANELSADVNHETPIGSLVQQLTEQAVQRFGTRADQSQLMAEWYSAHR